MIDAPGEVAWMYPVGALGDSVKRELRPPVSVVEVDVTKNELGTVPPGAKTDTLAFESTYGGTSGGPTDILCYPWLKKARFLHK